MFRLLATFLSSNLTRLTAASAPSELYRRNGHAIALRGLLLRQAWAEDSGYWDYALLLWYDELVHLVLFNGITAMTEFGWTEKALFNVAYASVHFDDFVYLPQHMRRIQASFMNFGRNLSLFFVLVFTAYTTFGGLLSLLDL
jgi:hypothetical protein